MAETKTRRLPVKAAASSAAAVGTECWYRLRTSGELVPATVVDHWEDEYGARQRLLRPKGGTVHLEIELDPELHHASAERGLRLNVLQGDGWGQWQAERPATEDRDWAKIQTERAVRLDITRELARGRGL